MSSWNAKLSANLYILTWSFVSFSNFSKHIYTWISFHEIGSNNNVQIKILELRAEHFTVCDQAENSYIWAEKHFRIPLGPPNPEYGTMFNPSNLSLLLPFFQRDFTDFTKIHESHYSSLCRDCLSVSLRFSSLTVTSKDVWFSCKIHYGYHFRCRGKITTGGVVQLHYS